MINELDELQKTLHIRVEDVPFVQGSAGIEFRMLQYRPDDNLVVIELQAQPGAESPLHRHLGPVLGWTTKGAWGHDRTYSFQPNSYIFETPGVIHRFLNGPEVTRALYVLMGATEQIDPESLQVIGTSELSGKLTGYLEACESAGLPRPNVLT
jgi:2,4'-dihydroxyacetophenone dioxygenase